MITFLVPSILHPGRSGFQPNGTDRRRRYGERMEPAPPTRRDYRRVVAVLGLIVLALATLPASAALTDEVDDGLVVPLHLLVMTLAGIVVWTFAPAVARPGSSVARRVGIGAVVGVGSAAVAVAVFFLLLNGFSGA